MNRKHCNRLVSVLLALASMGLMAGCATTKEAKSDNGNDPIQGVNRAFYAFNDRLDKYILEPVAKKYDQYYAATDPRRCDEFLR